MDLLHTARLIPSSRRAKLGRAPRLVAGDRRRPESLLEQAFEAGLA
jgi:hypothetical protein